MIEWKDLHVGDIVWYGNIEFTSAFRTRAGKIFPSKYKVERLTTSRVYLSSVECPCLSESISFYGYGRRLGNTLYSSEEDLLEDWSCVINDVLDKLHTTKLKAKDKLNKLLESL